jgi:8-oxo-dGTP pyrophosphatase MutT (NUDIX family)
MNYTQYAEIRLGKARVTCTQGGSGIIIILVKAELKKLLGARPKRHIEDASRIPSAVLIPLYENAGSYHIVFIKRTDTVKAHKGQISFPGGTCEKEDSSLLETALRESYEEIGLKEADVEILGELDDELTTTSNYIVAPFVGLIPWPYRFVKNRQEVDEILKIPLTALLDKDCLKLDTEVLNGKELSSYAYHHDGRVIWGATARILYKFLDIITQAI